MANWEMSAAVPAVVGRKMSGGQGRGTRSTPLGPSGLDDSGIGDHEHLSSSEIFDVLEREETGADPEDDLGHEKLAQIFDVVLHLTTLF